MATMQKLAALNSDGEYFTMGLVVVGDDTTTTLQVTYINDNATVPVTDEDTAFADKYQGVGKGAAVSFEGFTQDVTIDLNYDSSTMLERVSYGETIYESVTAVRGSDGENSVILGSKAAETIFAGMGSTTINGGAGRDVLYGYNGDGTKFGSVDFVFESGDGKDTIYGFEAYDGTNILTADNLDITSFAESGEDFEVKITNGNVRLSFNSSDQITLMDMEDETIYIQDELTAVGNDLIYDSQIDVYLGEKDATVTVGDINDENINVWMNLDGIEGFEDFADFDNVKTFDASSYYGNAIIVGELNEGTAIYGGHGVNSLWGGGSGNDTLYGGEGPNEYYYLSNGGNDVIENAKDDEIVNLLGIQLDNFDIQSLVDGIGEDSTEIKFNDGGSIKVNSSANVQFKILDKYRWQLNSTRDQWEYKGED